MAYNSEKNKNVRIIGFNGNRPIVVEKSVYEDLCNEAEKITEKIKKDNEQFVTFEEFTTTETKTDNKMILIKEERKNKKDNK